MEQLYAALGLVGLVLLAVGGAFWAGWFTRDRAANAELALVNDRLERAGDAIEVLKADAVRQGFASAALVHAERSIAEARAAGSRRDRVRLLLSPDGGPDPGPAPAGGGAGGPGAPAAPA